MKQELQRISSDGHTVLRGTLWWDGSRSPRGLVQLVHGMCEYVERYEPFAETLAAQGYAIFGADHLGHGRTADRPEELGYFGPEAGWQYLVEDVGLFGELAASRFPGAPRFLLGHSMGSFITRLYLTRYGRELAGAVLIGTGGPNPAAGPGLAMARVVRRTRGERYRSPLLDRLVFGGYNRRVTVPRTRYDWLTRDSAVAERYVNDPKCAFCFTAGGFVDLLTMVNLVNAPEWFKLVPPSLPIFLMSGGDDPVGDYGAGVRAVATGLRRAGVDDLSLKIYPGGRHEILNEWNRQEVYGDIVRWLEARLPASAVPALGRGMARP